MVLTFENGLRISRTPPREVWALVEKYNDITQEDESARKNLVDDVQRISDRHKLPVVDEILRETASELDRISRRRR